jgi:heme a synthase
MQSDMGNIMVKDKQAKSNNHPADEAHYGARNHKAARRVALWLYVLSALVALMVVVGGATRLTDSGLSITQWDLLMGAMPPMSEEKWAEEFDLYRQIPEYEHVNKGMNLAEFKGIYWWEWSHRNLGRFIGMAFLIPFLIFLWRGDIASRGLKLKLGGAFILLMGQGLMGWLMVKSGLTERVDVSQYRLAAHLFLAFLFYGVLLWMAFHLSLRRSGKHLLQPFQWARWLTVLVSVQILLGALVAGLRAGKTFNTWPLMSGHFIPPGYFKMPPHWQDVFETIAAVQFNHRIMAYIVIIAGFAFWFFTRSFDKTVSRRAGWILMALIAQMFLGIWTLLSAVPISLGLAHQLGALAVLSLCVYFLYWSAPESSGSSIAESS